MDWPDGHELWRLTIPYADLGVPGEVLHRALDAPLVTGPVYPLLHRHVARLCAGLPAWDRHSALEALGQVTVDLVQAVLLTAGASAGRTDEALEQTLPLRLERYLLEHLADPALTVRQVAAAHFVSLRQLYYVWSSHHDEGVAEWVVERRLERAAQQLRSRTDGVSVIAQRCGFSDAAHFSRRFRAHYGQTPSEWRAAGAAATRSAPAP